MIQIFIFETCHIYKAPPYIWFPCSHLYHLCNSHILIIFKFLRKSLSLSLSISLNLWKKNIKKKSKFQSSSNHSISDLCISWFGNNEASRSTINVIKHLLLNRRCLWQDQRVFRRRKRWRRTVDPIERNCYQGDQWLGFSINGLITAKDGDLGGSFSAMESYRILRSVDRRMWISYLLPMMWGLSEIFLPIVSREWRVAVAVVVGNITKPSALFI